jgi:hypothetical protein
MVQHEASTAGPLCCAAGPGAQGEGVWKEFGERRRSGRPHAASACTTASNTSGASSGRLLLKAASTPGTPRVSRSSSSSCVGPGAPGTRPVTYSASCPVPGTYGGRAGAGGAER